MTNSSNKQEIMVFVFLIVIMAGALFFVKYYKNSHKDDNQQPVKEQEEKITRVLLYHSDNSTYKITQEDDYISIKSESDLDCDVVDCDELDIPTTEITEEEIKKEAKNLLNELFKKEKSSFLEVTNNDLTIDQISSLELIINSLKEEDLTYSIQKEPYKEKIISRGYAFAEEKEKNIVVIAMGEKKTGGYSISIEKVITNNSEATIYVSETSPKPNETVTQAFTYPNVQIEFNRKPTKITVINEKTKEIFREIEIKNIDYKYSILTPSNNEYYKETGFTIEKNSAGYLITISMGQKNTNGYSINVEKVEIQNNIAKIYVKEKHPGAIAVDTYTYPTVRVLFENELPKEIHVINVDSKEEYKELKKEE